VLAIPSVVIPAETNFVLNPRNPDFRRIKVGKPRRFETDLRLIKA
jgi:RES domain-containing protein